ncbi:MAG: NusG domain II-containing protein [Eubacterium sp.]|nr:NusG domain II-containing protein [Eubacterium sp.]MDE5974773.1 NusG domain II-containing protein [Eubacterium sp.]
MKKADFILIGSVAVIAAVLFLCLYVFNSGSGDFVQIEVDGAVTDTISLSQDTVREIKTDNGTNTLVISDGSAVMTQADCPDGICSNHKPINKTGESIICLPHKVVVTVISDKSNDNEIDAVA